jgi:hypothetical protein
MKWRVFDEIILRNSMKWIWIKCSSANPTSQTVLAEKIAFLIKFPKSGKKPTLRYFFFQPNPEGFSKL